VNRQHEKIFKNIEGNEKLLFQSLNISCAENVNMNEDNIDNLDSEYESPDELLEFDSSYASNEEFSDDNVKEELIIKHNEKDGWLDGWFIVGLWLKHSEVII
jgi:hypothetical protein